MKGEPPYVRLPQGIPLACQTLLSRCLAADPSQRPSMEDVVYCLSYCSNARLHKERIASQCDALPCHSLLFLRTFAFRLPGLSFANSSFLPFPLLLLLLFVAKEYLSLLLQQCIATQDLKGTWAAAPGVHTSTTFPAFLKP